MPPPVNGETVTPPELIPGVTGIELIEIATPASTFVGAGAVDRREGRHDQDAGRESRTDAHRRSASPQGVLVPAGERRAGRQHETGRAGKSTPRRSRD